MAAFADTMRPPAGGTVREGVIDDLARYYDLTPQQVVHRCLHWEEDSVQEWRAASADTPEGLTRFYNSVTSWSFDLLWYSYLQTVGFAYPKHVVVADWLRRPQGGARMLDFGSGVGVTAQLFAALGYDVTLGDISAPLLDFAQWRLERRGVKAAYLRLPAELPPASYDLVIALDTLAHVPDAGQTARQLYAATRPGGHLVTNFDTRRKSERNAWHLYHDDLPLRWGHRARRLRSGTSPRRKSLDIPGSADHRHGLAAAPDGCHAAAGQPAGPGTAAGSARRGQGGARDAGPAAGKGGVSVRLQPIRDRLSGFESAQAVYGAVRKGRTVSRRWAIGLRARVVPGRSAADRCGRILAYHSIGTAHWGINDVSPRDFERHLQIAVDDGWSFVTPAEVLAEPNKPRLALTFDDGVASVLTHALPVLRHHGIPATAFIVTGWADGRQQFGYEYVLDWPGVRALLDAGMSIASHSVTHPDFGRLSMAEARRELEVSRERLHHMLGVETDDFAIPLGQSGNWTDAAGRAAGDAGYRTVFAQAVNTRPAGTVPRTFITRIDQPMLFRAALAGAFDGWEE